MWTKFKIKNACYQIYSSLRVITDYNTDSVFATGRIINVEVRVISNSEYEANNSYRDFDNFAYHKNRIQQLLYYTFQRKEDKTGL